MSKQMSDQKFKLHLEKRGYLMDNTSCYVPGNGNVCCSNRWERNYTPYCKKCLKRFDELEGEPIPAEIPSEENNEDSRFITWKVMQMMAVRRLTGEYTEEQAKIVREEYIKLRQPKPSLTSAKQEKQRILTQLFG